MKAASFILILLICSYVAILSAVSLMQSIEVPKVSQNRFDSNSTENILTDGPVEPQDPGSGGGGEGVI